MLVPFSLRLNPIQRLLLLNFRHDPVYTGMGVQRFDDATVGQGIAVIATRRDRRNDIYFDPSLTLDRSYDVTSRIGGGIASRTATPMDENRFNVTAEGVQLDLSIQALDGRRVELHLHEHRRRAPTRFTLLAPAGHGIKSPTFFPLFWMNDFSFVGLRHTQTDLQLGGQRRTRVRIGVPWKLARYGLSPVTAIWDERRTGALPVIEEPNPGTHVVAGSTVQLSGTDDQPRIAAMSATNGDRHLTVEYHPPVASMTDLPDGAARHGRVVVAVNGAHQFGGHYHLKRRGSAVHLVTDLDQPWRPDPDAPGRTIFKVLKFFRTWPTTYRWSAIVDLDVSPPTMRSDWTRK